MGSGTTPFGVRLASAMASRSALCVGIDPHAATLAAWGLGRDEQGLTAFGATLVGPGPRPPPGL
ncbi:MAG: hypothetical protein V4755_02215 [Curtobacterium sp.]